MPPVHSVTSLPVISKCTPPGTVPSARWMAKKLLHLAQDGVEGPRLEPGRGLDDIAVHRVTGPQHAGALGLDRADQARQVVAHLPAPKRAISVSRPASFSGFSLAIRTLRSSSVVVGPHFRPIGFWHAAAELDMRAIGLARAVADPDHVTGPRQPLAGGRVEKRQSASSYSSSSASWLV